MSLENSSQQKRHPVLVVVMGVSGTGKSTLANAFAKQSGFIYLDADSLHSEDAIAQMSRGIPLTDKQREPWIERIFRQLCEYQSQNKSCILAYSGLKREQRKRIFSACQNSVGVLLHGEQGLITERLAQRRNHFMSPQLLSSQIAEMEPFAQEIPLLRLNVADSIEQMLLQLVSFMFLIEQN